MQCNSGITGKPFLPQSVPSSTGGRDRAEVWNFRSCEELKGARDPAPAHAFGEGPILLYITSSFRGKEEAMAK